MKENLISIFELLQAEKLEEVIQKDKDIQKAKEALSFNLFTLSSVNNQLENFHSDVIAEILNPEGKHGEGNLFLRLFVEFLNQKHATDIPVSSFECAKVEKEKGINDKGRIDILIHTDTDAIIIENKINNAPDMDKQLLRYYQYCKEQNLNVRAIIYLSLNGFKKAPNSNDIPKHLVKNIAAYNAKENDLVTAWLKAAMAKSTKEDNRSLLNQYSKLIKYLANVDMDMKNMDAFFKFVSENNHFQTFETIAQLNRYLPKYRMDKLVAELDDCTPFQSYNRFKDAYAVYMGYFSNNVSYKLDVYIQGNNAGDESFAFVMHFWIPDDSGKEQALPMNQAKKLISNKLTSIGLLNTMNFCKEWVGYRKVFKFSEHNNNAEEADKAAITFVKDFMERLKTSD